MRGGAGNDTYVVDNIGDRAVETSASDGVDMVRSTVSFVLGANVENLLLTGTAALNGTGNTLNNAITGNAAANVLNGGAGADSLRGEAGNDIYLVDNVGDRAVETSASGGVDLVRSTVSFGLGANVENLLLTGTAAINGAGNTLNNTITGNAAANLVRGFEGNDIVSAAAGNDRIYGGLGNDRLTGGTGADLFYFDSALNSSTNVDIITDYSVTDDTIVLDQTVFAALALGTLSAGSFHTGASAQDADDRIIYNSATGNIFYDADGSGGGAQVLIADIATGLALTNADFAIIG